MSLSGLSIEKLGQLFPIFLTDYNPAWSNIYLCEKEHLLQAIGADNVEYIDHIGSTAIPGIKAKPTIDILIQIKSTANTEILIKNIKRLNYFYIPRPENPPPHIMMTKGYTEKGFAGQSFHLHIRYAGNWDEIVFRDYLIVHPEIAEKYVDLKLLLAEKFRNNREDYTNGKTEFVKEIVQRARQHK